MSDAQPLTLPGRPTAPRRTPLATVAGWLGASVPEGAEAEVTGISLSTQRIQPGDVYAALPGARAHGASYAAAAASAGAVAVLTDAEGASLAAGCGLPLLVVDDARAVLGDVSARIYGEPARDLRLLAVTGTQGKTTTTRLAELALEQAGVAAAVIGTVGTRVKGEDIKTALTTPEAPDLHGLFAMMRERGVDGCAMEVSSHALVLGRVDGVQFDVAVFLNLGRDHLDFHHDLGDYFAAKARLFTSDRARLALVNIDDEHGRILREQLAADAHGVPVRTFSTLGRADWSVADVVAGPTGSEFTVVAPDGRTARTAVPIAGDFNVSNALAAVAGCVELGYDLAAVAAGLAASGGVPGRLERVETGRDLNVVVDYAHKPDAVEAALRTLRPLVAPGGRLICVIGAGGDRDTGKRPVMGEIAARLADLVVVTDDNPRSEEPAAIRAAVLAGCAGPGAVTEIGDRREAIRFALAGAKPGDIVLVAGKGHETGQEVAGVVHPFDDRVVVREEADAL
ncbi:UDP-N-acetylmuramoyl-L-alanyl-D-glutamate--2,6-diaminopimelate ligase [Nocardioides phosphati]|uniref:UDP-N-acetylmuramoyl-L-alanyl-D-glutamate--2,6-diaminopimelate ligase n=1 Tax=Nocardioides phosphati TaxID=1867775 RepID=A0ABQ2N9L0_9ACTN|nr:UDP-N-acetylmuramoyl-L-alanyl-D-glutamate--2,6-diaminopimelate ligase [Nocardioides phosphati]